MNIKSWFEWSSTFGAIWRQSLPSGSCFSKSGQTWIRSRFSIHKRQFDNMRGHIWKFVHMEFSTRKWFTIMTKLGYFLFFFFFGPFLCPFVLKIWLFSTFWKRLVQWRLIYQTKRRKRVALLASSLVYISCVSNYKSLLFSNLKKGRLQFIYRVGWLVGWGHH